MPFKVNPFVGIFPASFLKSAREQEKELHRLRVECGWYGVDPQPWEERARELALTTTLSFCDACTEARQEMRKTQQEKSK